MRFDDYPSDDDSHFGLNTALLHEMPSEDFEVDGSEGIELSLTNILVLFGLGAVVIFLMFVVLP